MAKIINFQERYNNKHDPELKKMEDILSKMDRANNELMEIFGYDAANEDWKATVTIPKAEFKNKEIRKQLEEKFIERGVTVNWTDESHPLFDLLNGKDPNLTDD